MELYLLLTPSSPSKQLKVKIFDEVKIQEEYQN